MTKKFIYLIVIFLSLNIEAKTPIKKRPRRFALMQFVLELRPLMNRNRHICQQNRYALEASRYPLKYKTKFILANHKELLRNRK